jgi:hypothetical protein
MRKGIEKMEKQLFRVKVILYVMAENESEARVAATNARFDIFECTARKATRLEPGWDEAVPYNSEDARTCAEIFSSQQQLIQPAVPSEVSPGRWEPKRKAYANSVALQVSPR